VFFGTVPGGLHAISQADGAKEWDVAIPGGVWNAPVVHEGRVIVGGRDGKVYCVGAADGKVVWTADVGAPLLNSPAVDAGRGRVYVGAEDMCVYALDLASGRRVWRSPKVPGVSFRGYHPVVTPDGSVVVTTTPCAGGDAMQQVLLDMAKEVFSGFASWRIKSEEEKARLRAANFELMKRPETYRRQIEYLRKRLTDEPALQTVFVLDPETGRQRFVAPIVYAESMNGPASPPVVTAEGKVIVKYGALLRSRYEHYSPFLNVGYLDTRTGDVTPVMDETRTYGWYDSLLLVHDEQSQLVAAGGTLVNTHQDNVNALDLRTLRGSSAPWANGVHEVKPGVGAAVWATLLHWKELPVGWEWLPRGTAVYGGGSAIDAPVVVAGDAFYFLPTHEISAGVGLVAYSMAEKDGTKKGVEPVEKLTAADMGNVRELKWDWDLLEIQRLDGTLAGVPEKVAGTRAKPLWEEAKRKVAEIKDEQLDALILTAAEVPAAVDSPTRWKLGAAVAELIGSRWRPLLFPGAKAPAEAYRLFTDPTETLYTLGLAYPYLDEGMRARVRAHVAAMSGAGGPLDGTFGRRSYDLKAGEVRSAYDEAPAGLMNVAKETVRSETARVYAFWLWARVTGDWERRRRDWPAMKKAVNLKAEKGEADLGNGRISGGMAACRIAKELGDTEGVAVLLPAVRGAIRERLEYELAHMEGGLITAEGRRTIFGRWHGMTPDLARVLGKYCGPVHRRLMEVYVDHHRPAWYVAWNVELLWRNEAPFSFPDMAEDVFAARTMVLGEGPEKLAGFVDLPWCRGDECYVRKLAMVCMPH
jgi:hypothetical protein